MNLPKFQAGDVLLYEDKDDYEREEYLVLDYDWGKDCYWVRSKTEMLCDFSRLYVEKYFKLIDDVRTPPKAKPVDGACPQCGELGRYRMSVPVCSKHGPY